MTHLFWWQCHCLVQDYIRYITYIWNVWSNIRATFPHRMQPLRVDSKDWMWLANQNCTAIDANIYKPVTNICTQITKIRAIFSGQSYHYFTNRVRIWSAPHSHQLCLFVCLPMFFSLRFTFPLPQAVECWCIDCIDWTWFTSQSKLLKPQPSNLSL